MPAGSFAQNFDDWATTPITIEPFLGTFDDYGEPQYGAGVPMFCHIEDKVQIVRNAQGEEKASNAKLYVIGGPLDPLDRITMPPGYKGHSKPPILWVSNLMNRGNEFSHSEVYL